MNAIDDGGSAFPYSALLPDEASRQLVGTMYADSEGMTLRDYFAAKAVVPVLGNLGSRLSPENSRNAARIAYDVADAMLAARAT